MPGLPIPPERWLLSAEWGRDLVHLQNGDDERIDLIHLLEDEDDGTTFIYRLVRARIFHQLIDEFKGGSGPISRSNIARQAYEVPVSFLLSNYIYHGRSAYHIARDKLPKLPSSKVGEITKRFDSSIAYYLEIDDIPGTTLTGKPIRGFIVTYFDDEDKGKIINLLPMGDDFDLGIMAAEPTYIIHADDPETEFADQIRRWPERNLTMIDFFQEGLDDPDNDLTQQPGYKALPPAARSEMSSFTNILHQGFVDVSDKFRENAPKADEIMTDHADEWATLIVSALSYIASEPDSILAYPKGADPKLVTKALSKGTGSRKAIQRLAAAGYRPIHVFGDMPHEVGDAAQKLTAASQKNEASKPAPPTKPSEVEAKKERVDPRKAKREKRSNGRAVASPAPSTPQDNAAPASSPAPSTREDQSEVAAPVIIDVPDETGKPIRNQDTDRRGAEIMHRALRDLPKTDSSDWRSAIATAASNNISRRLRIATAPRESEEAARKRIASGINERIENLNEFEEIARAGNIPAWTIDKPSTLRPPELLEDLDQPMAIVLTEVEPEFSSLIAFPGVTPGSSIHESEKPEIILLFELDEDELSIHAVLVEGCLSGYRRLDLNLETGDVEADDAESDDRDPVELADRCYAALADVLFGPVDISDAWTYEQEHDIYRNKTAAKSAPAKTSSQPSTKPTPAPDASGDASGDASSTPERTILPSDACYASWSAVSRLSATPILGTEEMASFTLQCAGNTPALSTAMALREARPKDNLGAAGLRLARAAIETGNFDLIESPSIPDGATLQGLAPTAGILVLRDIAFFESVSENLCPEGVQSPGKAICILYRLSDDGLSALALQTSNEREITFANWIHGSLDPHEDDDDALWYVRGCLHLALGGREVEPERAAPKTLPEMVSRVLPDPNGYRQGPRRIVAQARLQPESMSIALATIVEWFDEQVQRHGDNLIADLREEGDWTIEHLGHDRSSRTTSLWSVTVRTTPDSPATIDVIVQTTLATGVQPRLPQLIRRIAERTPTMGPDGKLETRPRYVNSKGGVLDLVRLLQSPERTLPVILMTQDDQGLYARDPDEVASQSLGAATVIKISAQMTYELTDTLGQEYRTFYGAVGIFQPGFDPDEDGRRHYYRIMPDTTSDRSIASAITLATSATVTRYDIDPPVRHAQTAEKPSLAGRQPLAKPRRFTPIEPAPERKPLKLDPRPVAPETKQTPALEEEAKPEPQAEPVAAPEEQAKPSAGETADHNKLSQDATPSEEEAPEDQEASKEAQQPEPSQPVSNEPEAPTAAPQAPVVDPEQLATIIANVVDQRLTALGITDIGSQLTGIMQHLQASPAAPAPRSVLEDEIETLRAELKSEREAQTALLDEADAERRAATAHAQTLRQALNDQRRLAYGKAAPEYPENLSGLSEWLERNVLPNVVITSKAWRSMRKVDYRDMERLCETLKLLDTAYFDMRAGEDGAREAWEAGMQELRLQDKKQARHGGAKQDEYVATHEGQSYFMDKHLRGAESLYNDHTRLLRIYYTWDEEQRRVIIGHMPTHLTTKAS